MNDANRDDTVPSLKRLESVLTEIERLSGAELAQKREEYFGTVCDILGLKRCDSATESILDLTNTNRQRQFIALALVRLAGHNQNIIREWEPAGQRGAAFAILDEQLGGVFGVLKLNLKDQNHLKLRKYADIETSVLEDFKRIAKTITNIRTALEIRELLMRSLRSPLNRLFIDHFCASAIASAERIDEIFTLLEEYNRSPGMIRISAYQTVFPVISKFNQDANECPSLFTETCLVQPMGAILAAIAKDIGTSEAVQETRVTVEHPNRKYPFHLVSEEIDLKFVVRNQGPGIAMGVGLEIVEIDKGLELSQKAVLLGDLRHDPIEITFKAKVTESITDIPLVRMNVSWNSFGAPKTSEELVFELPPQKGGLKWNELKSKQPYSLEAVKTEKDLVGRNELIGSLLAKLESDQVESSIIWGQKRVGKTSIARTIQTKLQPHANYHVVYMTTGDLDKTAVDKFVADLGNQIIDGISLDRDIRSLERPPFDGSLSPLVRYFKNARRSFPYFRFIIMIDEFDEIPIDLYPYTKLGDGFFQNMRAISSEGHVGFVLVGGENMRIIKQHTDKLNKFDTYSVDYFDKSKFWKDFQDLVRRPLPEGFEIDDEALLALYEMSEGNPFYTKIICREVYRKAYDTRNAFISKAEVLAAIHESIHSLDTNHVSHFWIDGIVEADPARRDKIETQRRRFLVAFATTLRCDGRVTKQALHNSEILHSDVAVEEMIGSFAAREILLEDNEGFRIKPRFLEKWFVEKGGKILTASFRDSDAIEALKRREDALYVTDDEIVALSRKWGCYRGREVTPAHIRAWLNQFADNIERRHMFVLLENIKFYSEPMVRENIKALHSTMVGFAQRIEEGERHRRDILLSGFGEPSKSGSAYARLYASENKVFSGNVVSFDRIPAAVMQNPRVSSIIFVDDIIASGQTVVEHINRLDEMCGGLLQQKKIQVIISSICGLSSGLTLLESKLANLRFKTTYKVIDPLNEEDRCFGECSRVFDSKAERECAENIAREYGAKLQRKHPLGYDNSQLLVVFFDNCPNNTLPILYAEHDVNPRWIALFKRG